MLELQLRPVGIVRSRTKATEFVCDENKQDFVDLNVKNGTIVMHFKKIGIRGLGLDSSGSGPGTTKGCCGQGYEPLNATEVS
jgi:hypothetical protein